MKPPHDQTDDAPEPPPQPRKRARKPPAPGSVVEPTADKPRRYSENRKRPPVETDDPLISAWVVRQRRYHDDMGQAELAARMGVSVHVLSSLERGKTAWLASQMHAVANAFDTPLAAMTIDCGLSAELGMSPEDVIARDGRLEPYAREFILNQYRAALALHERKNPTDG